jgi:hypothetical protein
VELTTRARTCSTGRIVFFGDERPSKYAGRHYLQHVVYRLARRGPILALAKLLLVIYFDIDIFTVHIGSRVDSFVFFIAVMIVYLYIQVDHTDYSYRFSFHAFSCLAFSCLTLWSRIFMSRIFMPCNMVPQFHVSHFHVSHFLRCRNFMSRIFSRPPPSSSSS